MFAHTIFDYSIESRWSYEWTDRVLMWRRRKGTTNRELFHCVGHRRYEIIGPQNKASKAHKRINYHPAERCGPLVPTSQSPSYGFRFRIGDVERALKILKKILELIQYANRFLNHHHFNNNNKNMDDDGSSESTFISNYHSPRAREGEKVILNPHRELGLTWGKDGNDNWTAKFTWTAEYQNQNFCS